MGASKAESNRARLRFSPETLGLMRNNEEYITHSINIAAFLYVSEIPLITIASEGRDFIFENKDGIASRLVDEYHQDGRNCSAKSLFVAQSTLKTEVARARGPRPQ